MKKVLIAGCSFVQRMGPHTQNEIYDGVSFKYASFGGQGLWKIEQVLKYMSDLNDYDYVVVQLPAPVRNTVNGADTTERFCTLIDSFDEIGKEFAIKNSIDEYKQKIKDINILHDNIIFFWYNIVGYPFRHPFDYGDKIIGGMYKFFEDYNFIDLSFEGKPGYHLKERPETDEEFVDYYYKTYPSGLKGKYNDNCCLSKVPGTIVEDGHPNQKADLVALRKIYDYIVKN